MALADLIVVMNDGRIEQAGAPREIFNAPRTEFVARFIGGHNVIATATGPIAVRADRLVTAAPGGGRRRRASTATVRAVEYQGTYVQLALERRAGGRDSPRMVGRGRLRRQPRSAPATRRACPGRDRDVHHFSQAA